MIFETLMPRHCPVCSSRERSQTYAKANIELDQLDAFAFASRKLPEYMHWRLAECACCDLLYADPIPTPETLAKLYRNADFDSSREAGLAGQTYASFLPRIASRLPDRAGAVDVGTGDGAFLRHLLAAGFTGVAGVEPSQAPVAAADPEIRPLIRLDVFRDDLFPSGSLTLITCFQTIEHLTDPLAFCRAAFKMLKPGGALFLIGHETGDHEPAARQALADLRHRAHATLLVTVVPGTSGGRRVHRDRAIHGSEPVSDPVLGEALSIPPLYQAAASLGAAGHMAGSTGSRPPYGKPCRLWIQTGLTLLHLLN